MINKNQTFVFGFPSIFVQGESDSIGENLLVNPPNNLAF